MEIEKIKSIIDYQLINNNCQCTNICNNCKEMIAKAIKEEIDGE